MTGSRSWAMPNLACSHPPRPASIFAAARLRWSISERTLSEVDAHGEPRAEKNTTGMHQLTATFHVSTPLFLGNAAQEPELLAAPFKRALRFWWRALNYHLVETDPDHAQPFKKLQEREGHLFGRAADDRFPKDGRCPFNLRVAFAEAKPKTLAAGDVLTEARLRRRVGMIYLGYGLLQMGRGKSANEPGIPRGTLDRGCWWQPGGFEIRVDFAFPKRLDSALELVDPLALCGLLGGLGARQRRGFGSLSLLKIAIDGATLDWPVPTTKEEYAAVLKGILQRHRDRFGPDEPRYTAFGSKSRVEVVLEDADSCEALNQVGLLLQRYRSWGKKGVVADEPRECQPFKKPDHDWYVNWASRSPRNGVAPPQRVVFGLPQPYTKLLRVIGPRDIRRGTDAAYIERRASPLLVHVHRLGQHYGLVLTLMPAIFLPVKEVSIALGNARYPEDFSADFDVIDNFFDAEIGTGERTGEWYFPHSGRVWP